MQISLETFYSSLIIYFETQLLTRAHFCRYLNYWKEVFFPKKRHSFSRKDNCERFVFVISKVAQYIMNGHKTLPARIETCRFILSVATCWQKNHLKLSKFGNNSKFPFSTRIIKVFQGRKLFYDSHELFHTKTYIW